MDAGDVTSALGLLGALWTGYQEFRHRRKAAKAKAAQKVAERTKSDLERIRAEAGRPGHR